jgi:hypothetical protein
MCPDTQLCVKPWLSKVCYFARFVAQLSHLNLLFLGNGGDEGLAKHLNSYFELLVRTCGSQGFFLAFSLFLSSSSFPHLLFFLLFAGGDVFKFAGDAMIVLWPPSDEEQDTLARRAAQVSLSVFSLVSPPPPMQLFLLFVAVRA